MNFFQRLWRPTAPDTPDHADDGDERESKPILRQLEFYSDKRKRMVGRFKFLDPLVEPNIIIHLLALSLLLWIWGISLARAHTFTLFSFHPVFMSLGTVLFMTEGILAYRNHSCFSFLAPIMRNSARVKLQNIHRGFNVLASVFVAMGMAFILGNKVKKHRTILPTSIHAALGLCVCAGIVLQILVGIEKLDAQRSGIEGRGGTLHRWHGKAGLLLYDFSMATVATGLIKSLSFSLMTVFLLVHVCVLWLLVHLTMSTKPFRPTGENGLSEREMVDLNRQIHTHTKGEGGGNGEREGLMVAEGGGRRGGSVGGGRKDSSGEINESI